MNDHDGDDDWSAAALPMVFQPMLHNKGWDFDEEQWPYSRIAPDIAIHSLRGTYIQPQDRRAFEVGSVVFSAVIEAPVEVTPTTTSAALQGLRVTASSGILTTSVSAATSRRIARVPAGRLISFLERFLTRHAFDSMIAPYAGQEQNEYFKALHRRDSGAWWIVVRMYVMIVYLLTAAAASSVISRFVRRAG